jgi:hypothetical protein
MINKPMILKLSLISAMICISTTPTDFGKEMTKFLSGGEYGFGVSLTFQKLRAL